MYKVLITTSGTGSRLGVLTKDKNKALIEIKNKKVIDYIIQSHNSQVELVIMIGYKGNQVRDYIQTRYTNRKITYICVEPYNGTGSSLGYSLLQAKNYVKCPFIFHCNDTIVKGFIPSPEKYNWNGIAKKEENEIYNPIRYSTVLIKNNQIHKIQMKGAKSYDALHIGLVGIKNYENFWQILEKEYKSNPNDSALNDVVVISRMIENGVKFKAINYPEWHDTGSINSLVETEKELIFIQ